MITGKLKIFATKARKLLLQGVRNRLEAFGFNDDGSVRVAPEAKDNSAIFDGQVINDSRFVTRWNALRDRIVSHGVKEVVEEAAYTWFNRLMAIRILEYNSLAPALLDYENPEIRIPRIVTDARAGKTPVLSDEDRASLESVIGNGSLSFEQFSILIRAYCENNPIIRNCFGGITDYTVLLLPADILGEDGFIDLLNKAGEFIEPDDYRKPELIGWLYQFYISEKKDIVMKQNHYDKSEIPAATQIFTPNWIVKYMVENTLGRIYLDNNPDSPLSENWKYLVEPADTERTHHGASLHYDSLEDLKCGDLSCGSGHILNEMFDLLYQLYAEDFYSPREAIEAILTKNMVGIDLDDRARQLAQFALLLKACQTDTAFADGHCMPRIYSMPEVSKSFWHEYGGVWMAEFVEEVVFDGVNFKQLENAFALLESANVLGSIMKFDIDDITRQYLIKSLDVYSKTRIKEYSKLHDIAKAFHIILALTDKYAALCMNPPYMVPNKNPILGKYTKENYAESCSDMATIFIDVMARLTLANGQFSYIIPPSWMFLSCFEKLRRKIIDNLSIQSLLHLSRGVFGADFGASSAVIKNCINGGFKGTYFRLIERTFQEFDQRHLQELFEKVLANHEFKFRFKEYTKDIESIEYSEDGARIYYDGINQKRFEQIPGAPIIYWFSDLVLKSLTERILKEIAQPKAGLATGDNTRYMRLWHEVDHSQIGFGIKDAMDTEDLDFIWYPCNSGGRSNHWYGGAEYVVNWHHNGTSLRNFRNSEGKLLSRPQNIGSYFKEGLTWNKISSGNFVVKYKPIGAIFDDTSRSAFVSNSKMLLPLVGCLSSKIAIFYMSAFNPTMSFTNGDIERIPIKFAGKEDEIAENVKENISISKQDWDAHETSWDFQTNPLLDQMKEMPAEAIVFNDYREEDMEILHPELARCDANLNERQATVPLSPNSLKSLYIAYRQKWTRLFGQLLLNEEEINKKFIEIYGLQDELSPDVCYKDITILQQGEMTADADDVDGVVLGWQRDVVIKQFISYAVGCMMGRYRLDRPGLAIAHPNPSADEYAPYIVPQTGEQWWIDDDGIVPMMGEDSPFHDNAANRFTEFVRVAFGNDSLTENMNFVRDAIGKDVVDYFRSDFYTDHKKMYQNRPIYWMFSSNQKGKRAAFQCLVYMHRMNRFTPEHIRTNYLLPYIDHLAAREAELSARSSLSAKENKLLKQLRSDLDECRDYQLRLHEFADRQIEIDLDDGVVKNYATFAPVLAKLK